MPSIPSVFRFIHFSNFVRVLNVRYGFCLIWREKGQIVTVCFLLQGTCAFPTNQTIEGWNLTTPELLQLKPAQCIVVCDTDCLRVSGTPFWLHNIYLRFLRTERSDKPTAVLEDTSNEVCVVAAEWCDGARASHGPTRLLRAEQALLHILTCCVCLYHAVWNCFLLIAHICPVAALRHVGLYSSPTALEATAAAVAQRVAQQTCAVEDFPVPVRLEVSPNRLPCI